MGIKSYELRAGGRFTASDELKQLNPDVPKHLRYGAYALWMTEGRYSNSGNIAEAYRDAERSVYLWYAQSENLAARLSEKGGEASEMLASVFDEVGKVGRGVYEVCVKDLEQSNSRKGIIVSVEVVPGENDSWRPKMMPKR